jgi:hypothetical protein
MKRARSTFAPPGWPHWVRRAYTALLYLYVPNADVTFRRAMFLDRWGNTWQVAALWASNERLSQLCSKARLI